MSTFNQDAWELIAECLSAHPEYQSHGKIWLPQPEPCDSLLEILKSLDSKKLEITQSFKPFYHSLKAFGSPAIVDSHAEKCSLVLLVPTRQKIESLGLMAQGLLNLKDDGRLIFACANAQGAGSFVSHLKQVIDGLEVESGNKCKWAVIAKNQIKDRAPLEEWIKAAGPMMVEGSPFQSVPGIYGWNKIDRGSEILLSTLPILDGVGADFGSGYGYLSHSLLSASPKVNTLHLIEADQRALDCSEKNLSTWKERCRFHWLDIADRNSMAPIKELDWIVMNPPFHEGRDSELSLGKNFINAAARALGPSGQLFMVSNAFLPYEDVLKMNFKNTRRILVSDGFKVIHAER